MNRLMLGSVAVGVALAAAPAAVTKPTADAAFGSGVRSPLGTFGPPANFSFNATSAPNGENSTGTFVIDFPGLGSFTADVTCLNVSGKTATLLGLIRSGTGAGDPGNFGGDPVYFVAAVSDTGKPRNKQPSPDQMSGIVWDTEAILTGGGLTLAEICADPGALLGPTMVGLVSGDLTVVDK